MDLTLDEQKLVADFRRLSAEGRQECLDITARLVRTHTAEHLPENEKANQCRLPQHEERPEAAKEPIFTE